MTTKTTARASIREARETLRVLERALASDPAALEYLDADKGEPLAILTQAWIDTLDALGLETDL